MKTNRYQTHSLALLAVALAALRATISTGHAQSGTFTYQGRLSDGANPASGIYDLRFAIYDAVTNGVAQAGPLTNSTTTVSSGLFTVTLNFGAGAFNGADRWLDVGARTNGSAGAYQPLSPRQQLTATPYATRAANFSGAISDAQLSANVARLNANNVFTGAVQLNDTSNIFVGSFTGNGAGVSNVNLLTINSQEAIVFGNNAATFSLASSPGVGNLPRSVTAADVNGDGKPDLICANIQFPGMLTVLTNDGSGGGAIGNGQDGVERSYGGAGGIGGGGAGGKDTQFVSGPQNGEDGSANGGGGHYDDPISRQSVASGGKGGLYGGGGSSMGNGGSGGDFGGGGGKYVETAGSAGPSAVRTRSLLPQGTTPGICSSLASTAIAEGRNWRRASSAS